MTLSAITGRLRTLASEETAKVQRSFFKTGQGEYGEGDIFIGVKIPALRALAREFEDEALKTVKSLLKSKVHEERMLALLILIRQFNAADTKRREQIYNLYFSHTRWINNWDLVDGSAPYIVGPYLWERDRSVLYSLAKSASVWERRIAILSTHYFIRKNDFADTLKIFKLLLADKHDLIHKAVGWMLREIGKRDLATAEGFLKKHCRTMPRTALRYAIERLPEPRRKAYLSGAIERKPVNG